LLLRLDEHGDQLGRGHELPAAEDPARGGVAVRLRLGTGREVVLTLTASAPAVSRAPRCKCSDCEPSVFETTRVQVKDAAARVQVCRPAASGACPSVLPLIHAVPGREVGLHAQSSHPPPERG